MKVLIEARPLIQTQRAGIAYSTYWLCRALLEEAIDVEIIIWALNLKQHPFSDYCNAQFQGKPFPPLPRRILEQIWKVSHFRAVRADADIYHLPFAALPARRISERTRLVTTINDLAYIHYPEVISDRNYLKYLSKAYSLQARTADAVIAISQSTKNDIVEVTGVSPEKITVIHLGTELQAPSEADWLEYGCQEFKRLQMPERYFLCVGTWEPRKNLIGVFKACHALRETLEQENIYLCIAGGSGWKNDEAEAAIQDLNLGNRVLRLGYVPRKLLPHLYARSLAFLFPSLYEGFGLPVVEAMSCGAPVVTSNVSSLPEISDDAALMIDPKSEEELATAMKTLIQNETLRLQLMEKGFQQARRFSWQKMARETLQVYESVLLA